MHRRRLMPPDLTGDTLRPLTTSLHLPAFWIGLVLFVIPIGRSGHLRAQEGLPGAPAGFGTIKGRVVQAGTQEPLPACNVILLDTLLGGFTDRSGEYLIVSVPPGIYRLRFQFIGCEPLVRSDVVVRPGRITFVNAELKATLLEGERVTVSAGYFPPAEAVAPTSTTALNAEEVRRFPGSAGDVSRILQVMPSTAQVADNQNDLVVRGGSPSENAFLVDGFPVPGLNHFPVQGATGGPIGFLNVDFIDQVAYSAGGFGAAWGDRLSAVVDVRLREGNREETDTQLDLHLAGLGASLEGPLAGGRGSWLLSARRSFLDLLMGRFQAGGVPVFGDVHAKAVFDLSDRDRLSCLDLYGQSGQAWDRSDAVASGLNEYGSFHTRQNTTGVVWRHLWAEGRGFSTSSLSLSTVATRQHYRSTATTDELLANDHREGVVHLRQAAHREWGDGGGFDFGFQAAWEYVDYDIDYAAYTDRLGQIVPPLAVREVAGRGRVGVFASRTIPATERLGLTLGLRADYSGLNGRLQFAPRLATRYRLSAAVSLTAAGGLYHQALPYVLVAQDPARRDLPDPRAVHVVLGLEWLLSPATRLTVEVYEKVYNRCPVSPSDPARFVLDDGISLSGFGSYPDLEASGRARVAGVEALLQQKLARTFYGFVSGSLFRARYRGYDGVWRDRAFDNRYLFSVVGGWKPSATWEVSLKWGIAGGRPYTPFDPVASAAAGTGIVDEEQIQGARLPTYHTLDVRLDRRLWFRDSSLVLYVSVWNLYDRRNIEQYYWDEYTNRLRSATQWRLLPVFGLEWEF